MNASIYRISLNIQEAHSGVCLDVKRGDTKRTLHITLMDGDFPYKISEECYAVFTAIKPDGKKVFNHCQIEGNMIIYELTPQTVAVEGFAECEIKLYGSDDNLLTSACFGIVVNEGTYNAGDEFESETEVEAFTHMMSVAADVVARGTDFIEKNQELVDQMEAAQTEMNEKVDTVRNYANTAVQSSQGAQAAKVTAMASAESASSSASAAEASRNKASTYESMARTSAGNAATSEENAKTHEENAKRFADTIDTEQIEAKISARADNLYFDPETSLLYLTSEGQIIGDGVQVATTGGGGSGNLSYLITLKNLLETREFAVSEGTTVELRFSYASVDEDGMDDGPGIGKVIVNDITKRTFTANQGENPPIDVTPYLTSGTNTVKIQVENSENAKKVLTYWVTLKTVYLTSAFDVSAPFTGAIPFIYTPTGIGDKTVYFELDGKEIGKSVVTHSGRQQSFTIPAQSHGAHNLRVWFDCEIEEGTTVPSNVLHFTLICLDAGNNTPIIAVNTDVLGNVEQFSNIVKKYRVYDPTSMTAEITLEATGSKPTILTVDRTEQTWTYRPTEVGELVQTIRCGDEYVSWTQNVIKSSIHVEAETEALALYLSSYGRNNTEENPGVWESGNVACEFHNFNFVSDGWVQDEDYNTVLRVSGDARLIIPYKMFAYDFRTTGKTIEFELATREVLNYDAEVINCFSGDRGFTITAQQLRLKSEQSEMKTRYKEDEHIRVSFVVEKKYGSRLLLCYINGIMSGALQYPVYPTDDDFSQNNPVDITIGSNDCTTDLYNIRVYDNDLTRHQVLDNWIADTQNQEEKVSRYLRNQIYDAYGRIVISQLPADLPYMVIRGRELPQFKDDKKTISGYFVDPVDQTRSFTFENAQIDVQGTSSQDYYVKNYKIKFKGGFTLADNTNAEKYQMNPDAIPVDTFTMKADVASSEGAFNVVLAMIYDDLCPFKTPAQQADPRIRQTIEGFPMVMFWDNGSTDLKFLGKYNFNNDKGTEDVFGFKSGDESWEIKENGSARVGWHSADFSGDGWKADFEARYPDKNTNITKLQQLAQWLVSTDTGQATGYEIEPVTYGGKAYTHDTKEYRLAKFSAELSDHFVEEAVIYYYLFTDIFLSIDQREKNAFPTYVKDLDRWIVLFYDADSSCGTDNKGNLAFDYYLEDIDYTQAGNPVYNGQNSVLWKNLRATRYDAIMAMYQDLRTRTENKLSYDYTIGRFEAHQSKWPEAIFNEDMYRKCLEPLIQEGDGSYLRMLQGKKEQWMKWWLYNRFRYLDSKYLTGTARSVTVTLRAHEQGNIFLKSYVNMYGHVKYNSALVSHRMERGKEYEFVWPALGVEDADIDIYDGDRLTSLGDLSPIMVEKINVASAHHLTELKVGDSADGYTNYVLAEITLGNNKLLRKLDLSNCVNLTQTVDASGCTNIEEVYLDGTSVTGVGIPNGGILKVLHLPDTVTNLTVLNQKAITDFVMPVYGNVTTLRVENSPAIPVLDILAVMPANSRVRILGFDTTAESASEVAAFYDRLDTMRGMDESGNTMDKAQVSGTIRIPTMTSKEQYELKQRYPDIHVVADEVVKYTVLFKVGNTVLQRVEGVGYMESAQYTGTTPNNTAASKPADYMFIGWNPEPVNILGDTECYAQFRYSGSYARELVKRTIEGHYENDRVTTIGEAAFQDCRYLKSATFKTATTLYGSAFNSCYLLEKVDFHALTKIASDISCFGTCLALKTVILRSPEVITLNKGYSYVSWWKDIGTNGGNIYVPKNLVDAYKSATNWNTYADYFRAIEDYPEICGGE